MVKTLLSKASIVCLLSMLFVMNSMAVNEPWYCDPNNGTYSIIDQTYSLIGTLPAGNPYMIRMPQNIAPGEVVYAHFKTRCVGNATNAYQITVTAKDEMDSPLNGMSINWKKNDWSDDNAFVVPETTAKFEYLFNQNRNTKLKYVKLWVPMPVHLDAEDQVKPEVVEVGQYRDFFVNLNTFYVDENNRNLTIQLVDGELDASDFQIIRGSFYATQRCGYNGPLELSQQRYFVDTNDPANMFIIRFSPSADNTRSAKFIISNGAQQKTITVSANAVYPSIKFNAVGAGSVHLIVNGDYNNPVTQSPYYFQKGDKVRFVAVPSDGSHFVNWNLNPFQRDTAVDIVATRSICNTAYFALNDYKICVNSADETRGRAFIYGTKATPCQPKGCNTTFCHPNPHHPHHPGCRPEPQIRENCETYPYGTEVNLVAQPAPGYIFMGWTSCDNDSVIVSFDATVTVTVGSDTCLTAQFTKADEVFHFVAETENGMRIVYPNEANMPNANMMYQINDGAWVEYTIGDTITVENLGDIVYMTAKTTNASVNTKNTYSETFKGVATPAIWVSDTASVVGNIMYLLDRTGELTTLPDDAFRGIFATDPILNADQLMLPAETMAKNAYHSMFHNCASLISVPVLPATTLAKQCYSYMFWGCTSLNVFPVLAADSIPYKAYESIFRGCTSLTSAPELPATKIDDCAYRSMFRGCVSLEEAPALPATNLSIQCYESMFEDCSTLEAAPVLPASVLVDHCYRWMFRNCTNLAKIQVAFTDWGSAKNKNNYTASWTQGVALNGIFICPEDLPEVRNTPQWSMYHNIPELWSINVAIVNFDVNDDDMGTIIAEYTQGNIPIMDGEQINFGDEVRFTATPNPGYIFDHFEDGDGNFIIAINPFAININEDRTIVAVFVVDPQSQINVNDGENASYVAVAEGRNIVVKDAADANIYVYDAAGRMVGSVEKAQEFETIGVQASGVYFVYVPGQCTTRVIVK